MKGIRRRKGEAHFRDFKANEAQIERELISTLWSFRQALLKLQDLNLTDSAAKDTLRKVILNLWELRELEKFSAARRWSRAAKAEDASIIYEHVIPMNEVTVELLDSDSIESFQQILRTKIVSCIVTTQEHRALEVAGLRQKTPEGSAEDIFARYRDIISFDE